MPAHERVVGVHKSINRVDAIRRAPDVLLRDLDGELLGLWGSLYGDGRRRPPQSIAEDRQCSRGPMHDGRR